MDSSFKYLCFHCEFLQNLRYRTDVRPGAFITIRTNSTQQTFYIFFGAAVLLGIASGLILHVISRFSSHLFGLDPSSDGERRPTGHSAASYRAARERKRKLDKEISNAAKARMQALDPLLRESLQHAPSGRISIPQSPSTPRRRDSLLATTILEEVDDSEEDYGF